jgi:hypothetical protein
MANIEMFLAILFAGTAAGMIVYWTHEFENWSKWAIGLNCAVILLFTSKDLWSWLRYESGNFEAFLDALATGVTPSMMLGMAGLKAITYTTGLIAGALFLRREYRFY